MTCGYETEGCTYRQCSVVNGTPVYRWERVWVTIDCESGQVLSYTLRASSCSCSF